MIKYNTSLNITSFIIGAIIMLCPISLNAFSLSTYTNNSVLSEGKWVKVCIPNSGVYMLTYTDLQNWGFSDPSKVNVYGYGGKRLPDVLSATTFIDDLPLVQSQKTSKGIVFYAQGPETWSSPVDNQFSHSLNPFSSVGYYFISDREPLTANAISTIGLDVSNADLNNATTTFTESIFHEKNLVNHGETGHLLLGEDFKYTPSQSFHFSLTDIVPSEDVWLECSFATKTKSVASLLSFTANGTALEKNSNDKIQGCSESAYIHGRITTTRHKFKISNSDLILGINLSSQATIMMANLNYITINYTRRLNLLNGMLNFRSNNTLISLSGANQSTHVWDVTKPQQIYALKTYVSGNSASFQNEYTGLRNYVAWDENATLPSPTFVSNIPNQNLHALDSPDMVIFTVADWHDQAERIADLHRNSSDSLKVIVLNQDLVFNEFGSGVADVNALRKLLKMFWDRGKQNSSPLKYALLFGRGTFDNQHLTSDMQAHGYKTIPMWQSDKGLDDNESFCTDDILAFLKDNSGANLGADYYCIGVGRMPVRNASDAKIIVDKLYRYVNNSIKGEWKNNILLVADDMDNGVHMEQSESMFSRMNQNSSGKDFLYNKLYIDAYTREGNSYPQAKAQMFRLLNEGTVWWNYIGHANTTSWTHDGLFSYTEMSNLYLKKYPFLYAATCDFLRWDANATSGAEVLFNLNYGGIIGAISASRPVYIANNGYLSNAIAPFIVSRDENGNSLTIGDIFRNGKNNLYNNGVQIQDRNKLRFALMGDPAMRLSIPSFLVKIVEIDGAYVEQGEEAIIQARQNSVIKGRITDIYGNDIPNFNGIIHTTLYDAEKSTTSHGYTNKDDGKEVIFEEHGDKLYAGRDSVINGEFSIHISMPTEIANNYRPATLNLYAQADNEMEAIGCNRDFFVYGFNESSDLDTIAPTIDYMYLNHEGFENGSVVNESPMLIAQVSDNVSINLSTAGVGHQITLRVDGEKDYTDVSLYYTPLIGENSSGKINYPINNLSDGQHTLRLKVWDTSGNSTEQSIDVQVKNGVAPIVFDVYTDENPAHDYVNFYIKHDRPDAITSITVSVYDLMGRLMWESSSEGPSDMYISSPLTWDLRDFAGRRVNRGIYVYKASITTDGQQYTSSARRLAVASQ